MKFRPAKQSVERPEPTTFEQLAIRNPAKLSQNFFGSITKGDIQWTITFLAIALVAKSYRGNLMAMLVVVLWIGWMWRQNEGRTHQMAGHRLHNLWIRWANHSVIGAAPGTKRKNGKPVARRLHKPAIPLGITYTVRDDSVKPSSDSLDEQSDLDELIGLIRNKKARTDSVVISGSGSDIPSLDMHAQRESIEKIATVIKRAAAVPDTRLGVSFVFSRRPKNTQHLRRQDLKNDLPEVVYPRALAEPGTATTVAERRALRIHENNEANYGWIRAFTGEVDMVSVWTLARPRTLKEAARGKKLAPSDVSRVPIFKVNDAVCADLAGSGVSDVETLDLADVHRFLHGGWDLDEKSRNRYDTWEAQLEAGLTDEELPWWPQKSIVAHKDHIVFDGKSYFSVLALTASEEAALPWLNRQLFAMDIPWLTIAQVGEPVKSTGEELLMNKLIPTLHAFNEGMDRVHVTPGQEERETERQNRLRELHQEKFTQTYSVLIAIGSLSLEGVNNGVDKAKSAIRANGMDYERITGECLQLSAFLSATTGVSLL